MITNAPNPKTYEWFSHVGAPQQCADRVMSWEEIRAVDDRLKPDLSGLRRATIWGRVGWVVEGDGVHMFGVTDTECRWFVTCCLAAACGFPPHWTGLGYVYDPDSGGWENADGSVAAPGNNGAWLVYEDDPDPDYRRTASEFASEVEARLHCMRRRQTSSSLGPVGDVGAAVRGGSDG